MNESRELREKMKNNEKILFQISEAARACGVSRSTLLRMEEKGLLKPAHVSEESGRRYYDNFNVAQIMQVEKFKSMGLNSEEIINYYASGGQIEPLRAALEYKLCELQNGVEELRLRSAEPGTYSISEMIIPEIVCVMRKSMGHTIKDKYEASFNAYAECIRKGYRLSGDPLFTISDRSDYLSGHIGEEDYAMYSCVPLKEKVPEAVVLPRCKVFSVLYYGSYDDIDEAWLTFGRELNKRNLKPTGMPRALGLVAPYTGKEIAQKRYCSRFVVPIE